MELTRYRYIEYKILGLVLQYHGDQSLGYPATIPELETFLRQTLPSIEPHEVVEALKRLWPKRLGLSKYSDEQGHFIEYSAEMSDDKFFHRDSIRLRRTPETDPYMQDLAALFPPQEDEPSKKTYGFLS